MCLHSFLDHIGIFVGDILYFIFKFQTDTKCPSKVLCEKAAAFFSVSLIIGTCAALSRSNGLRYTLAIVTAIEVLIILWYFKKDITYPYQPIPQALAPQQHWWRRPTHSPNRWNSILTLFSSLIVLSVLYVSTWYYGSQRTELSFSYDSMNYADFPSVAVLQKDGWWDQANLRGDASPLCYLGYFDSSSPNCKGRAGIQSPDILNGPCTCQNQWSSIKEDFPWQDSMYRYLYFNSTADLFSIQPNYMMLLQVSFDYDTAKSNDSQGFISSPGLYIAIYDKKLELYTALATNLTTLIDINANGVSAINLHVNERSPINDTSFQTYDVTITSIPTIGLVCDHAAKPPSSLPCTTSIYLRIPNFMKTNIVDRKHFEFSDIAAMSGAYLGLVIFLAWLFSGLFREG